jgi:hypothetical protein
MMNADDVLNQAAQGQISWIQGDAIDSLDFCISQSFEDLIERELQLLARSFE